LFELRAEWLQIRFQKPDVATHYAEVGNLLSLYPRIQQLAAHAKETRGIANGHRQFCGRETDLGVTVNVIGHGTGFKAPALSLLVLVPWRYVPKIFPWFESRTIHGRRDGALFANKELAWTERKGFYSRT
jgi:hypothetical protein